MKKRIVCAIMSAIMVVGMMTGCGNRNNITQTENNTTKNESNISETNDKELSSGIVEAYKEFYSDFYKDHLSDDENLKEGDCAAKLVMDGSGNLFLAVTDMQSIDEDDNILLDLYIFEYKDGAVCQRVKLPNIKAWDDGMGIATAGDNLIVWTSYYGGNVLFTITGDEYNEFKVDSEFGLDSVKTGLGKDGRDAGLLISGDSLVNLFFTDCGNIAKFCVHGQDFEDWLDYYAENEVTSSLKLSILYAEYLEKNRYYELDDGEHLTQYVQYWKNGIYYTFIQAGTSYLDFPVSSEDCLYVSLTVGGESHAYVESSYLNENTLASIPEEIDGIKVVVTDESKDSISQAINQSNWKHTYLDYFKGNSDEVIYSRALKLGELDSPLIFYITSDHVYKLYYIDGTGTVQELYSGDSISGAEKDDATEKLLLKADLIYQYDSATGKFVQIDEMGVEKPDCWFDGIYEEQDISEDWLVDVLAEY